jgi:cell pole-organizing protein PopZ
MTQPAKSQEPSMEEILASIRRIIADDDANKTVQRAPEPPQAEPPPPAPPPLPQPTHSPPPAAAPRPRFEADYDVPAEEPAPVVNAAAPDQSPDILDLTESMAAAVPQPPSNAVPNPATFRTIDGSSDVGFDEASDKPAPPAMPRGGEERERLISNAASAAVDSAFNALAQTVLVQNARTLEDLVREMLRPLLKSWLDDNLPGMVERMVRAEIERVSRGRTG